MASQNSFGNSVVATRALISTYLGWLLFNAIEATPGGETPNETAASAGVAPNC